MDKNMLMILAIDIGNTNIKIGICDGVAVEKQFRIKTDRARTSDDHWVVFASLLPASFEPDAIIISSVVPDVERQVRWMCEDYFDIEPVLVLPSEMDLLPLAVETPSEVGADRVVNCYAASRLFGRPAIIIDSGTATTFDILSEDGAYAGGLILPAPDTAMEGLVSRTALLPRIAFRKPETLIGRNTRGAMTSGLYYGFISQVEGIVERLRREFSTDVQVIVTGGLGNMISKECPFIDHVEPLLTLKGLGLIYEDFFKESET